MSSWISHVRYLSQRPGFLGFLGTTFCLGMALSFVIPFLSLWGTQPGRFSPFQFGLFMAALSLSGVVLGMMCARGSDTRISRRAVLMLGSGCGALGYTGFALVAQPWLLALVAVTLVATASVCFSQVFATAREWFGAEGHPGQEIAVTLSILRICFSLAWIIGPTLAATIVSRYDYSVLFLSTAAIYVVALLGWMKFVPPRLVSSARRSAAKAMPVWATITQPKVLGNFIGLTLISAAMTATTMSLPLAITDEFLGTPLHVGIVFGVGPFIEVPFMLWFGHLAAQGHGSALMRFAGVVPLLYFTLLYAATEVWQVCLIQVVTGISSAIVGNVAIVSLQNLVPQQPGLATAIFANSGTVGKLFGFVIFGLSMPSVGARGIFGISAAVAAVSCVLFLQLYQRVRTSGRSFD